MSIAAASRAALRTGTSTPTARAATPVGDSKRKRDTVSEAASSTVVFSQPASTSAGSEMMTNVVAAVDYLHGKPGARLPWDDIWRYLNLPIDLHHRRPQLKRALQGHHRVEYIPKESGGKEAFRYRPQHDVSSAEELKLYLQRQPTAAGLSFQELKDGWPGALAAVEELERSGWALVTRKKKDNAPRLIWPSDPALRNHIDADFMLEWHRIKLPANPADMRAELEKAGLTPTSQIKEVVASKKGREKKRRVVRKNMKTTNTHMSAVLKDYSGVRRNNP